MKDLFSKTLIKFSLSEIQINNFWEILDQNYSKKTDITTTGIISNK